MTKTEAFLGSLTRKEIVKKEKRQGGDLGVEIEVAGKERKGVGIEAGERGVGKEKKEVA